MQKALDKMAESGVVPVIQIDDIENALPLAKTLIDNGLPIAEVTLRSPVALDAIKLINKYYPDILLIAGTVTSPELASQASKAGAKLVVSPGFNPKTVEFCIENNIDILPGVATPGEMEQAMNFGLHTLKFFPAEANGGIRALKAISGPYTQLKFMATGGISPDNINDYLALDCVSCCGGSWMVDKTLIAEQRWEELGELIRNALR